MKVKDNNKPYFVQRLGAFIIDVILVSFVASLILTPFMDVDSISKLQESATEISEKYVTGEIGLKTFIAEYKPIMFETAKKSGALSIASVFINIIYFIVLQFYFKGQTLGKKITKIKVENIDGDLTINNLLFRSLLINSILCNMIILCFMVFGNVDIYFYGSVSFEIINYLMLLICSLMVMFGESGRGLHDYLGHTRVVKTN